LTAGEVIAKVSGKSWEAFVTDSIIAPLQMTNTSALSAGIEKRNNKATPYTTSFTGILTRVPYDRWDNLGPAASVVSNAKDLTNWLIFQLDSGKFNGREIMPFAVLQKTRDLNISTNSRKSSLFPVHFRGYGLGLFAADYNGKQIYWHTGGAAGMVSNVCFVPEERLGIAILTNNDNQGFFEALRYQLLDAYLGVAYVDRSIQQLSGFNADMQAQIKEIAGWKDRIKDLKPELPLSAYAGTYKNQLYGTITVTQRGKGLLIKFNTHYDLTATLDYMDGGEWLLQYNNIEYGIFPTRFNITAKKVQTVSVKANDFVEYDPYIFTKTGN
jgi:CubicO group peptidase (beta-lactamase class C family)